MRPPGRTLTHDGWQPADRPQRPVLFINPRSGGRAAARHKLAERARERGIEAVVLGQGRNLAALAQAAVGKGAGALGTAGGGGVLGAEVERPAVFCPAQRAGFNLGERRIGGRRGERVGHKYFRWPGG